MSWRGLHIKSNNRYWVPLSYPPLCLQEIPEGVYCTNKGMILPDFGGDKISGEALSGACPVSLLRKSVADTIVLYQGVRTSVEFNGTWPS